MITLQITDTATPLLRTLYDRVAPGRRTPLMRVLGRDVERQMRAHFRARDAEGNRQGWPRAHFWSRIRRATAFAGATDTTARVAIADPAFAAKVNGATIRPKNAKALAIPLRPEAKAAGSPRSGRIADLFLLKSKNRGAFLARKENGALRLYYKLVASVTLQPDPRAMPPLSYLQANTTATAQEFLMREIAKGRAVLPPSDS